MQRYPIAYLRRSSADATDPGDISREAQETAVRELARRDGYNGELRILADWDRSADEAKEGRRTGFLAMLAAIDRGECDVVYAASLDRLYRSMRTFVRLTDAAKANGTRIVTLREGVLGGDGSPMAQAFAEITAVFSGLELRTTKARAAGAMAERRKRGDYIGRAGYGFRLARNEAGAIVPAPDPDRPLEPVLAAVRETGGNILAACKLLNARGVPVPQGPSAERRLNGSGHWHPWPLRKIVERNAPELVPPRGASGRRTPTNALLAQLLVCHCGHVLTPEKAEAGRWRRAAYRCTVGNRIGREAHGPVFVTEAAVLPWIKEEVARLRTPDAVTLAAGNDALRAQLTGRLERAHELYIAGLITRERHAAEGAAVTAELDRLGDAEAVVAVPAIDWTWAPRDVNAILRAIFSRIDLGPDLRPVSAVWTVPEWRADDAVGAG
jgi:DNA invertase Pin-like site-specific DNA recombinase